MKPSKQQDVSRETKTASADDVLFHQRIDADGPGTILRDFDVMLEFLNGKKIELTTRELLPMAAFAPINEKLAHRIVTNLKRPTAASYPHVNGLFLILRALGLGLVVYEKNKAKLVLDAALLQSWSVLNVTERYFTLLEGWLFRGHEEIVGGRGGMWGYLPISKVPGFYRRIPASGLRKNRLDVDWQYLVGDHNVALMEMFGFITAKDGLPGKGWQVDVIKRLPWGDAFFEVFDRYYDPKGQFMLGFYPEEDSDDEEWPGLKDMFGPYFPEWKTDLPKIEHEFRDGVFVFRVFLSPKIWRRMAVTGPMVLDHLSRAILKAFKFDNDHLHEFTFKDRHGRTFDVSHEASEDPPYTSEFRVGDLPLLPGMKMTYLFDFGDRWEFEVYLEEIKPADPKMKKPVVLESHGEAPPQYPDEDEEWDEDDEFEY